MDCLADGYPPHYQARASVENDEAAVVIFDYIEATRRREGDDGESEDDGDVPLPKRSECLVSCLHHRPSVVGEKAAILSKRTRRSRRHDDTCGWGGLTLSAIL